jgi:diguanylate cyclase (GGDEF)-like protein
MTVTSGREHALPIPDPSTSGSPPLAADIRAAADRVRRLMVNLVLVAFILAMAAVTAMVMGATTLPAVVVVIVITVAGASIASVAMAVLHAALRRSDDLGNLLAALRAEFDRVSLDAIRDPLTGLGNHRAFQEELDRASSLAFRHLHKTAVLLVDVDDLKRVNDAEGHVAGDQVLRTVARVIATTGRRTDRAFRIGGDEFAILSAGATTEEALALGRRILATSLDRDRSPNQRPISLTIGISAMPDPSSDRHLVMRHADAALYWGKRHGRTDVQVYDPKLHGVADDERPHEELAAAVDHVIAERLLVPVYQPVFSLADGRCVGFEGLVRPSEGAAFRNAGMLFVAAETVNRTVELDLAAVQALASGASSLGADQYLAVNLSPRTLEAAAFNPHEVLGVLANAGIEPTRLVIELTEREAVEDMDRLQRCLATIRRTGARIAADDVGAGNAGLQLLSQVEFDIFKIDLSLVQSGAVLAPSRAVLRALIEMARRRGATTVAEGIETPIQLEIVRDLGINVGQGFLLAAPSPRLMAMNVDLEALIDEAEPEPAEASERAGSAA